MIKGQETFYLRCIYPTGIITEYYVKQNFRHIYQFDTIWSTQIDFVSTSKKLNMEDIPKGSKLCSASEQ